MMHQPSQDWEPDDLGIAPGAIWSDFSTLWVVEESVMATKVIRAFNFQTMERDPDKDITIYSTLTEEGSQSPGGIWSDDFLMFVVDTFDDHVYAFNMATSAPSSFRSFDTTGEIGNFNSDPKAIWADFDNVYILDGSHGNISINDRASKNEHLCL